MIKQKKKSKQQKSVTKNLIPKGNLLPRRKEAILGRTLNFNRDLGRIFTLDIQAGSSTFTSLFSAGVLASTTDIGNVMATAPLFSTTYGGIWREYRTIGLRWQARITNVPTTPQGEIWLWMDEKSSSTPSSQDANKANKAILPIAAPNGSDGQVCVGTWQADDLADLQFTQTSSPLSPVYLKQYASPGVTGTASTTQCSYIITCILRVQFRDQI